MLTQKICEQCFAIKRSTKVETKWRVSNLVPRVLSLLRVSGRNRSAFPARAGISRVTSCTRSKYHMFTEIAVFYRAKLISFKLKEVSCS